ncbi:NAD+ diphosphatase [Elusimicrobium posterum]|uniref:NAD(+) diphosphatase n=1 Tax=Elusimicrobium posterum TaxID=3116653 RepID=UPI003C7777AD
MQKKHYWFIFQNNLILLKKQADGFSIPFGVKPPVSPASAVVRKSGTFKGFACSVFSAAEDLTAPTGYKYEELRSIYGQIDAKLFQIAGKSAQIVFWDNSSIYCPVCSSKTEVFAHNAKICPLCKKEIYPVISAAAMVLVQKENSLLMVRGKNFRSEHYGLVAGFLETGETLEECAAREVLEETNLKIKNITYFASQPWPFPSGLMVGFFADYAGGKLKINEDELLTAEFFTKDNLPKLPGKISLARKMVDAWLKNQNQNKKKSS